MKMGPQAQTEGGLEGQAEEPKAEGESSPGTTKGLSSEQLSLGFGVQVYHELWERVQVRNIHQNPPKLLLQRTREERSIRRFRRG